jgi:hypothetical protein
MVGDAHKMAAVATLADTRTRYFFIMMVLLGVDVFIKRELDTRNHLQSVRVETSCISGRRSAGIGTAESRQDCA